MEQDRPYPGSVPGAPGQPRHVTEWVYFDAVTGEAVSYCGGVTSFPIPCQAPSEPASPPPGTAQSTPPDFASIRQAADAFAAKTIPSAKLWMADMTVSSAGGPPEITESDFYYVRPLPDGDLYFMRVGVGVSRTPDRMYRIEVGIRERSYGGISKKDNLQPTPAPQNVRSPDEILRRLSGGGPSRGRVTLMLHLFHAGNSPKLLLLAPGRYGTPRGFRSGDSKEYIDIIRPIAPENAWVWWTRMERDRPQPGYVPGMPGRPASVQEVIFFNAITGDTSSVCLGVGLTRIPCEAPPEPRSSPPAPTPGPLPPVATAPKAPQGPPSDLLWSAPPDFATLRNVADAFVAGFHPGIDYKLWSVDLTAEPHGSSLQIADGDFLYFGARPRPAPL